MNVIRTERLSPAWLEQRLQAVEDRFTLAVAPLGVVAVALIAAGWYFLMDRYSLSQSVHFNDFALRSSEGAFYAVCLVAGLRIFLPGLGGVKARAWLAFIIFAGVFASRLGSVSLILLATWAVIPCCLIFFSERGLLPRRLMWVLLALTLAVVPAVGGHFFSDLSTVNDPAWYLVWTDRLIMPFTVALFEAGSFFRLETLSMVFNPIMFFYVLPLSHENLRETEARAQLSRAFVCFIKLAAFKVIDAQVENFIIANKFMAGGLGLLTMGWINYLHYFLYSYFGLNLGIAVGRLLGFALEDGTHYSLLAATPIERWRRWNSYYYSWLFRFSFLPVFRRTRNLFWSIQLVFLVTFCLHYSRWAVLMFLPHAEANVEFTVRANLIFFSLHGLAVYSSRWFPASVSNANSRKAWFGVFATHLIMAAVHMMHLYTY